MKEKIYTIPLSEAYEEASECPFCKIEKRLEAEAVEYALGASMMEPDSRINSNEKGFCRRHFAQMTEVGGKALSLALVLDTHLARSIERIEKVVSKKSAGGLFKKEEPKHEELYHLIDKMQTSCVICEKIESTLEKFALTFWELYKKETDFHKKVNESKGFCLPHFALILKMAEKELSGSSLRELTEELIDVEIENLKRVNEDVNWFTKKFDYRFNDAPWKNSKDAPPRTIEKIAKFLDSGEQKK